MRVIGQDDVYPVKTFKVGLLHYFIVEFLIRCTSGCYYSF